MFDKFFSLFSNKKLSIAPKVQENYINYHLNDPTTPNLIQRIKMPDNVVNLKYTVKDLKLTPKNEKELRALNCHVTIANGINYVQSKCGNSIKKWATTNNLSVNTLAGNSVNAYYDRSNLKFFHFRVPNKIICTADSFDVVSHELGHAILDAIRPDFWNVTALEIWSFHEAFGDICAMVNAMQYDVVLNQALSETSGDMSKSNVISKLAEEMGAAIYNHYDGKNTGSLPNALRNPAVELFKYINPKNLPANGRDNQLLAECHSFGKVFSAAWYKIFVEIYNVEKKKLKPIEALKKAKDIAFSILILAIPNSARISNYYSAIAKAMINTAASKYPEYKNIVETSFIDFQIIPRNSLKILSNKSISDVVKNLKKEDKVTRFSKSTSINIVNNKKIKLKGFFAQSGVDLNGIEIDVAADSYYEFDKQGNLIEEIEPSEEEITKSALLCVPGIQSSFGDTWSVKNGQLIRNKIVCNH